MKGDKYEIKKINSTHDTWIRCFGRTSPELPNITILATGGTIAGSGETAVSSAYKAGQLNVEALIDAVLKLSN